MPLLSVLHLNPFLTAHTDTRYADDLRNLKYLRAVLNETLRLYR